MKKNINSIIDGIVTIAMICLLFANGNILVKYTKVFQCLIFSLIFLSFLTKKRMNFNGVIAIWIFMIIDIGASYIYSISPSNTRSMLITIILSFIIIFYEFDASFVKRLLNIIQNIVLVGSISILISVFIPEFIIRYCSFFVINSAERILAEINSNHYSGLFAEQGNAAFLIDIGIGIVFSKYLSKNITKKDYVCLIIFVIALLLTNKRALTAMAFINMFIMFIISSERNKSLKIVKIVCVCIIIFVILLNVSSIFSNIFYRFFNDDDNGRSVFKEYCIEMFNGNNLIGKGFNTFNTYIYNEGVRIYNVAAVENGIWIYHAHNVYYQLLGELGIIGFTLFIIAILSGIYKTITCILRNKNSERKEEILALYFSLFIQLIFLIYSYTGNTLYYVQQITIYFISLAITFNMQKNIIKGEKEIEQREKVN